ncbi:MAG: hypothetical protein F4137_20295 [Acidobacteria bacterium]|nr:hypothetical protein [Acidobacteriota bacterium]
MGLPNGSAVDEAGDGGVPARTALAGEWGIELGTDVVLPMRSGEGVSIACQQQDPDRSLAGSVSLMPVEVIDQQSANAPQFVAHVPEFNSYVPDLRPDALQFVAHALNLAAHALNLAAHFVAHALELRAHSRPEIHQVGVEIVDSRVRRARGACDRRADGANPQRSAEQNLPVRHVITPGGSCL